MSTEALIQDGVNLFKSEKYDEAIVKLNEALESIADKSENIEDQNNAQFWLGRCYFEKAIKTASESDVKGLFDKAIKHHKEQLTLATTISSQQQRNAQGWLGLCYLYTEIADEQAEENLEEYFKLKKEFIQSKLVISNESLYKDQLYEILASLFIFDAEARKTVFAHYTTANVCELLFGLNKNNQKASPMRMNSATYVNDPYEGKSLLEFIGQPDYSLENLTEFSSHNAFFSCFSTRINDLNQFRLYGKEDGIEASGCCLVFNKKGNWIEKTDITKSFESIASNTNENGNSELGDSNEINNQENNYALYQVAYIAYLDEYINTNKCELITEHFAIYLPKIGKNDKWHKIRLEKLINALDGLRNKVSETLDSDNQKEELNKIRNQSLKFRDLNNQKDLEYIRYLFKDFAFRDEEEFRLLTLKTIGDSGTEYCDKTNSVYVPYQEIHNLVDEVILGTNYEKTTKNRKVEVFRYHMKQKHPKVKVTHSSLPINANPQIVKD